jgi:hypothetical protein
MIATAAAGVMGAAPTDTYPGLRRTRPVHHTVGVCWCDLGHFECLLLRRPRPRRTTSPAFVLRRRRERPTCGRSSRTTRQGLILRSGRNIHSHGETRRPAVRTI